MTISKFARGLFLVSSVTALAACTQVRPGEVGVKINQYGSGAGVEQRAYGVGTYMAVFGTHYERFPISTKNYTWTHATSEQNGSNEEFSFGDNSGVTITADIGVNYSVDPSKAAVLYQKYRMDMADIVAGPLRNEVRNELVNSASTMTVQDVYGPGKVALLSRVEASVRRYFAPIGLNVEKLFWVSNPRPPQSIQEQITARIANENKALATQAQVATIEAEAKQRVAQAEGEAQAIKVQAEALKTNPEYAQLKAIEKWNGELPTYASNGPLPFIGNPVAGGR